MPNIKPRKPTPNQAEWLKQIRSLQRAIKTATASGVSFSLSLVPEEPPKRVTRKRIELAKSLTKEVRHFTKEINVPVSPSEPKEDRIFSSRISLSFEPRHPRVKKDTSYIPHPLSPEQRKAVAKKAAQTRFNNSTSEQRSEWAKKAAQTRKANNPHRPKSSTKKSTKGGTTKRNKVSSKFGTPKAPNLLPPHENPSTLSPHENPPLLEVPFPENTPPIEPSDISEDLFHDEITDEDEIEYWERHGEEYEETIEKYGEKSDENEEEIKILFDQILRQIDKLQTDTGIYVKGVFHSEVENVGEYVVGVRLKTASERVLQAIDDISYPSGNYDTYYSSGKFLIELITGCSASFDEIQNLVYSASHDARANNDYYQGNPYH